jgi:hypothetical protein
VIARRHIHLLIALLLPLMVMRGMLPAGYMPVADGGVFKIAMCSDGLQQPLGDGDTDNRHLPGSTGDCLFAHAASIAPPAQGVVIATGLAELFYFIPAESTSQPPATGPPRLAAARAPPAFLI